MSFLDFNTPYSRTCGMAEVIRAPSYKCEDLSSNPSDAKKKKERKKKALL
jgi:hypothetical protein